MTTTKSAMSGYLRLVHPDGMFGPTYQGEGPSTGRRAVFIRLLLCNLCCRLCDTAETWDKTRYDLRAGTRWASVDEIAQWTLGHDTELAVITGGEPLIQQRLLVPLVRELSRAGRWVEIETNGTLIPLPELTAAVSQFNVSPKLSTFGEGMPRQQRIVPDALRSFASSGKAVFKFVASLADLDQIAALATEFGLSPIWVMPQGDTSTAVLHGLRQLADPVVARGWNLTPRLHTLMWENERGR